MTTWYVNTTGSNSNVGDRDDAPFLTIGKAFTQLVSGDTVRIFAGTYTESNLNVAINNIKIRNFGDGLVVIDGNAASGSLLGNAIQARIDWVIDGSTGSNLQNIEIIGGSESCVVGEGRTNRSYSLKHVILTGRGSGDLSDDDNSSRYGIKSVGNSTIRNCVFRNFNRAAVNSTGNPGAIDFHNNIIYRVGKSSNTYDIIFHVNAANEIIYNTIVGCTGSSGIDINDAVNPTIKNNLLAHNNFSDSGIRFTGVTNLEYNCVYSSLNAPTNGAYNDLGAGTIDSSNLEVDPIFKSANPWDEIFDNSVSGDFSVDGGKQHYPESTRISDQSPILTSGTRILHITTDFSGSTRVGDPTIGALNGGSSTLLFNTAPTGDGLADKVLGDFTINHFNRISDESPRNVEQIPFSKGLPGPSRLKDRKTAYKVDKGN